VSGLPLDFAIAAAASQTEIGAATLHLLRTHRLIRVHGTSNPPALEMYHDRIREAVVAGLDEATLRGHHFRLAAAWEASGRRDVDSERIANHYKAAGYPERAFEHARRAAEAAEKGLAFDRAARLYRLTIALPKPDSVDVQELIVKLGDMLANAGRGFEAACAYEDAAGLAPVEDARVGARRGADAHELRRRA